MCVIHDKHNCWLITHTPAPTHDTNLCGEWRAIDCVLAADGINRPEMNFDLRDSGMKQNEKLNQIDE